MMSVLLSRLWFLSLLSSVLMVWLVLRILLLYWLISVLILFGVSLLCLCSSGCGCRWFCGLILFYEVLGL